MTRKKRLTNTEIIDKLVTSGLWTESPLEYDKHDRRRPVQQSKYMTLFKEFTIQWGLDKNKFFQNGDYSFMIPVNEYVKHIAPFRPTLPIGTQVRLRRYSIRPYERNEYNQDVGDTKNWQHVGIGSGKEYFSDTMREIIRENSGLSESQLNDPSNWRYRMYKRRINSEFNTQILIGNNGFCSNIVAAHKKLKYYKSQNINIKYNYNQTYRYDPNLRHFIKTNPILGDGIFGPKKLINGTISNVFIHFLYPKWNVKRESRFEVTFETGARGLFTSDYLDQIYDTDYTPEDNLYQCNMTDSCTIKGCPHKQFHICDHECSDKCFRYPEAECLPAYDYENLMSTTSEKGLDYADDNV